MFFEAFFGLVLSLLKNQSLKIIEFKAVEERIKTARPYSLLLFRINQFHGGERFSCFQTAGCNADQSISSSNPPDAVKTFYKTCLTGRSQRSSEFPVCNCTFPLFLYYLYSLKPKDYEEYYR
jgi:hypothetical protein